MIKTQPDPSQENAGIRINCIWIRNIDKKSFIDLKIVFVLKILIAKVVEIGL